MLEFVGNFVYVSRSLSCCIGRKLLNRRRLGRHQMAHLFAHRLTMVSWSSAIICSRITNFRILPVMVIGKLSTNLT
jgi:hypothetical protein